MKHVTFVYINQVGETVSYHIQDANTNKLQDFINKDDIHAIEYILQRHKTLFINEFRLYNSQDDLVQFMKEWSLDY